MLFLSFRNRTVRHLPSNIKDPASPVSFRSKSGLFRLPSDGWTLGRARPIIAGKHHKQMKFSARGILLFIVVMAILAFGFQALKTRYVNPRRSAVFDSIA